MLSGGQRRRVALLSGMNSCNDFEPVAILLDEADSGLDDDSVVRLAKTLRNLAAGGHSVLVASHDSRIVAAADRVIGFPFEEESNDAKTGKSANRQGREKEIHTSATV